MSNLDKYYINGEWVVPLSKTKMNVINPANEDSIGEIILANELDVNLAVAAAKSAFSSFSQTSKEERLKLLKTLLEISKKRLPELAKVISLEMGAPMTMSLELQADAAVGHLEGYIEALINQQEREKLSNGDVQVREPVGICGLITPWNWPVNQIALKALPALAAGCTCVLKPSEFTPLSSVMYSIEECYINTGQSCDAPTRLLVERSCYKEVLEIAKRVGEAVKVGDPAQEGNHLGPLVSDIQFGRVQAMIEKGIKEGATLLVGGLGKPDGFDEGYWVRPTIFADANNKMAIAQEEIFGPVLTIIPFDCEEEAIEIANDTPYGLAAYVQSGDLNRAERVAQKLRVGMVHINGGGFNYGSPFGGYKQSGNGREGGIIGIEDFQEVKTLHYPE